MTKLIKAFAISILLFSATSCLTIKSNKIAEVKDFQVSPDQKKVKIFTEWNYESRMMNNYASQKWHDDRLNKFITESNCCVIVSKKEEADISLSGKFVNNNTKAALVFGAITGASFYTIPSWMNVKDQINATADKNGKTYEYKIEDAMFMSQWLPFIVAVPIQTATQGWIGKREINMIDNIYKTLILEMKNDGLFNN